MNYYQLLNVPNDATLKEINKNYKSLSTRFHPDKNPGDKYSEEKMKVISQAYNVISDYEKRINYDKNINSKFVINPNIGLLESFDSFFNEKILQITDKNIIENCKQDKPTFF
jgi:DnaJ-class molecular chaperone